MDTNVKYYHTPTDQAVIKDFIAIVKKLKIASPETLQALMDDLHYVEEEHYPDGQGSPSADLDSVGSSRFNRSDLLPLPKPPMETEIEIKSTPSEESKPDMKKMLAEKVIMMAEKLGAKPETVAMLKKDCGLSEELTDKSAVSTDKPVATEEKPKPGDDMMEMLKQMSNR